MEFMLAPTHIIRIGPSDTFGREFNIVRYGSNTFDMNLLYHSIIAISIPRMVPSEKLIIVSYVVIHIWWNRSFVLYKFMMVDITLLGDDVINVFIKLLSDKNCQPMINISSIKIWVVIIKIFLIFCFFRYCLYSLDIVINTFPNSFVIVIKFFTTSVCYWRFGIG